LAMIPMGRHTLYIVFVYTNLF